MFETSDVCCPNFMRVLTEGELLTVWERGNNHHPLWQALWLLTAAFPEYSWEELAQWSIGRRDATLLALREWTFGPQVISVVACPQCGEKLELNFQLADIRAPVNEPTAKLTAETADFCIHFRLPTSHDLIDATGSITPKQVLERCVLEAWHGEKKVVAANLPQEAITAVANGMAEADPQADIQLALTCPACQHGWLALFDIVTFFWQEIHTWAIRLLHHVHTLAVAYGWREADILAMNPQRRQVYLDFLGQ